MTAADDEAILRLSGRYVLAQVTVPRLGLDLLDALIVLTVTQFNVERINRDPNLQCRFAVYDDPPPDELRRPVSVNSVSQALGMPFETIRRRVIKLTVLGVFKATAHGVYLPTALVRNRRHHKSLTDTYGRLRNLHSELDRIKWVENYRERPLAFPNDPPVRLATRVATDYLLRIVQLLMELAGDPVSAAIWLGVLCHDYKGDKRPALAFVDSRPPIPCAVLSRRLRISGETCRRRVHTLAEAGLCTVAQTGVSIGEDVFARADVGRLAMRNAQDLRRMFFRLAEYGIPQGWRTEAEPRSAAA